jgi:predicted site-specific integrase-resolvase
MKRRPGVVYRSAPSVAQQFGVSIARLERWAKGGHVVAHRDALGRFQVPVDQLHKIPRLKRQR